MKPPVRWLAFASVAALAACGTDSQSPTSIDPQLLVTSGGPMTVTLCKVSFNTVIGQPDDGTLGQAFDFEVGQVPGPDLSPAAGTVVDANPTLLAGNWPDLSPSPDPAGDDADECAVVWTRDAQFDDETEITITELVPDGFALRQISLYTSLGLAITQFPDYATSGGVDRSITFSPYNAGANPRVYFKNVKVDMPPPPPGNEGCTPGYWRQPHHYDSWVGYSPTDLFSDVFGVGPADELGDAVKARGGGANALIRHAVAALLNASSGDVAYPYSGAEVIAMVQAAYASGDYESTKDDFDEANNLGCTLN